MTVPVPSAFARSRARRYLRAEAAISRKAPDGGVWETIRAGLPVSLDDATAGAAPADGVGLSLDRVQTFRVQHDAFDPGPLPRLGDRLTITGTTGAPPPPLTVGHVGAGSFRLLTALLCTAEETAVETVRVTLKRRGVTDPLGPFDVQVVLDAARGSAGGGTGSAVGQERRGVLIGTAAFPAEIGDVVQGIPALRGVVVREVLPLVGDRREVVVRYTSGQGS